MGPVILLLAAVAQAVLAERKCEAPGIISSTNPNKFIACVQRDGRLQAVENECSKGQVFDIERKTCINLRLSLLTVISPSVEYNVTDDNSLTTSQYVEESLVKECRDAGAICSTCDTMSFCVGSVSNGEMTVRKILDVPCNDGSVCVTQQGCVKVSDGGLCREGQFKCGDVGFYPDLYDCTKYHECTPGNPEPIDTPHQCPPSPFGSRWDPQYSSCGWPENVPTCQKTPVPMCTENLQMGPAGGQVYYICLVDTVNKILSPKLFRCPQNSVFDAESYSCIDPNVV